MSKKANPFTSRDDAAMIRNYDRWPMTAVALSTIEAQEQGSKR